MKRFLVSGIILLISHFMHAQQVSVSTNLLEYAALGTMNADVSYSISRRWSLQAGARFNPFTFRKGDARKQFQLRQQSYSIGARLWPWHTLSGWWFSSKLRYQEYNHGGIISMETQEGDRFGAGIYAGYTYMLARHLNIEFGLGLWAGADIYSRYSCPVCGICYQSGIKVFILPDDIAVSLVYVF